LEDLRAGGAHHVPHVARHEVPGLVRAHDVVCVLSRWDDPFPLVVFEAMASGCAVVATARGGIPEAVGDAGALVASDDPDAVADILVDYATHPDRLREIKQAGRRRAESRTWRRTAEQLLGALADPAVGAAAAGAAR
jgi:glycosyltransferase involved in cell wall biosynthesis